EQAALFGFQPGAFASCHQSRFRRQRMLGKGMPDGRTHAKSAGLKALINAIAKSPAVTGVMTGKRPRRFTLPISAMAFSLSGFASPIKAMPCNGILRARMASI